MKKKSYELSKEYLNRAKDSIPAYTQTLAKGPTQYVKGVSPVYLSRGKGSKVWDVDGNKFIDFSMGIGPIILGYSYPAVNKAISMQLEMGTTFSLMHPLEVELAELLVKTIPCAESVRYGKNGADVTSAAIRVSRAFTKRDYVACCGYHGWHDWYAALTKRPAGIPQCIRDMTLTFKYNDIGSLEKIFKEHKDKIACVIMEPVTLEEPKKGFLEDVKALTHKNNAVLIFDEIWTGFRFSLSGFQGLSGVVPDMATFSKSMSNGMPVSALVGRTDIMKLFHDEVFFFLTMGGEALSLAAAIATITEIRTKDVIKHIWEKGKKLQDGYNALVREKGLEDITRCVGYPCRTVFEFYGGRFDNLLMKSLVQQEVIKRGVLWSGFGTTCFSHSDDDIETALAAFNDALDCLKKAIEAQDIKKYLKGEPIEPLLRPLRDFDIKNK